MPRRFPFDQCLRIRLGRDWRAVRVRRTGETTGDDTQDGALHSILPPVDPQAHRYKAALLRDAERNMNTH